MLYTYLKELKDLGYIEEKEGGNNDLRKIGNTLIISQNLSAAGKKNISMVTRIGKVRDIKVGRYIIIEGEPCEIVGVKKEISSIGIEKLTVTGIGILDGKERGFTAALDSDCEFLVVEIKDAQILAADRDAIYLRDLRTGKRFQVKKPAGINAELRADTQAEYIEVMGVPKLTKIGLQNIHSYT